MGNTNSTGNINVTKLRSAPILSGVFMGAGQLFILKQYIRGAFFSLVELIMLFFTIFEKGTFTPNFKGPVVMGLHNLITLGDEHPELPIKLRDHSIFMMITGLMTVIVVAIFICLYVYNVIDANKSSKEIIRKGAFPTMLQTRKEISQTAFPAFGIVPIVLLIAFFTVVPLLFSALVAFTNYSSPDHIPPNNTVDWVGFENFRSMFHRTADNAWYSAFARTAVWTVVWAFFSTFTCYFAGMFFAVVLQDKRISIPKFYRAIFILPYAIPTMLTLFIWANLLNGTFGPINRTLMQLGILSKAIPWLSDPKVAKLSLILVNIWIGFPYSMILTTSSMTAISHSLYEAATIDGANKWQQFKSITLPLVLFQTKPLLIMQFAGNINNFGAVFFLTGGGPALPDTISTQAGATDLLISWIYKLTMANLFLPPRSFLLFSSLLCCFSAVYQVLPATQIISRWLVC